MSEATEDEEEKRLEEACDRKMREAMNDRVRSEGFEIIGLEPSAGDHCQFRLQQKVKRRWDHKPCDNIPVVVLHFRGPDQPDGLHVPLCRRCVGRIIRDLVGYIDTCDSDGVSSRSSPERVLAHAKHMALMIRTQGSPLGLPQPRGQWYVLDGCLYFVEGPESYTSHGDYQEFCGRSRERGKPLPWD